MVGCTKETDTLKIDTWKQIRMRKMYCRRRGEGEEAGRASDAAGRVSEFLPGVWPDLHPQSGRGVPQCTGFPWGHSA